MSGLAGHRPMLQSRTPDTAGHRGLVPPAGVLSACLAEIVAKTGIRKPAGEVAADPARAAETGGGGRGSVPQRPWTRQLLIDFIAKEGRLDSVQFGTS